MPPRGYTSIIDTYEKGFLHFRWRLDTGWRLGTRLEGVVTDPAEYIRPYNAEFFSLEVMESLRVLAVRERVSDSEGEEVVSILYCREADSGRFRRMADIMVSVDSGRTVTLTKSGRAFTAGIYARRKTRKRYGKRQQRRTGRHTA